MPVLVARSIGRWAMDGTYTRYVYYEGGRRDATSELIAGVVPESDVCDDF